jgi:tRNA (guanine37-N1)-methyltransferase
MTVPCVRVLPQKGEQTRQTLASHGLLDENHDITVRDAWLYIPVAEPEAVPAELDVVLFDAPPRDRQTTPADLLGYDPSYERLGDIIILDEDDPERAHEIAAAVNESALDAKTVVNRLSPIEGALRIRDWEILVGNSTETVHREYGCEFMVDISEVYFSPRLATERHRVTRQVTNDERVIDMFAGVGPFAIPAAKRGAEIVGVDLNPAAIRYLRKNAERNRITEQLTTIEGDVCETVDQYAAWADRLVMNLPHSANEFLDTAVELAGDECFIHYYDIQHESDLFGPGEKAIRAAAGDSYEVEVVNRHAVRSYAPHEENICLDVRLQRI